MRPLRRHSALGYVSPSATPDVKTGDAPNPARLIAEWTRFEAALSNVTSARAAQALPALGDLAARFPSARVFQSTFARALKDTGDAVGAVAVYRTGVARWPSDAALYHDLAVAARAAGDV